MRSFVIMLCTSVFVYALFSVLMPAGCRGAEQAPRVGEHYQPRSESKAPVYKPRRVCDERNVCRDI